MAQLPAFSISRQSWPKWNVNHSKSLLKLNRQDLRNTIGVLTAHCPIGRHAFRLGIPHNDVCRSCRDVEKKETVEHLLCNCMALDRKRFSALRLASFSSLSEIAQIKVTKVNSFIKSTEWFN